MPPDPERVIRLFLKTRPLPVAEREQAVRAEAGADTALADEVLALFAEAGDSTALAKGRQVPLAEVGGGVLEGRLGEGAVGTVFRGIDQELKRPVAVKLLHHAHRIDTDQRTRFVRERELLAKLSHPNIVHAYRGGEENDVLYLVMELVDGQSLKQRVLARGPLPADEAVRLVRQAAAALQCLEKHQMVHRDIKPENLVVDGDGVLKVVDLGLARIDGDHGLTRQGALLGTLQYMAPEQQKKAAEVDSRADIYSLGCTLYFLLAGDVPFPHCSTTYSVLHAQRETPLAKPGSLAPAVWRVVERMTAKAPSARYANCTELLAALDACMDPSCPAAAAKIPGFSRALHGAIALLSLAGLAGSTVVLESLTRGTTAMQWLTDLEQAGKLLSVASLVLLTVAGLVTALWKRFRVRAFAGVLVAAVLVAGVLVAACWLGAKHFHRVAEAAPPPLERLKSLVRRGLADAGPAAKHFRFLTMDHLLGQPDRDGQADLANCQAALKRVVAALARGKDKVALFPVDAEKTVWMLDLRTTARPDAWLAASADDPYLLRLHGVGDPDDDAPVLRADAFIARLCAERALRDALGVMNADFQNDPTTRRVVAKYGAPLTASAAAAELHLRRSELEAKAGALPLSLQDKIRPLIGGDGTIPRTAWTDRLHGASLYQRLAEALEIGAPEIVSIHGD